MIVALADRSSKGKGNNFGHRQKWSVRRSPVSHDVPYILGSMAKLAARDTGAETVVADADRFVLESICKIVFALSHGSDKDTDAFSWSQVLHVISYPDNFSVKAKGHFSTIRR
jgi:hypothetical protein